MSTKLRVAMLVIGAACIQLALLLLLAGSWRALPNFIVGVALIVWAWRVRP